MSTQHTPRDVARQHPRHQDPRRRDARPGTVLVAVTALALAVSGCATGAQTVAPATRPADQPSATAQMPSAPVQSTPVRPTQDAARRPDHGPSEAASASTTGAPDGPSAPAHPTAGARQTAYQGYVPAKHVQRVPRDPADPLPGEPLPGRPDCRTLRCIALTFDDGPGKDTPRLLEVLRAKDVHATFFVLGKEASSRPDTVRAEAQAGHVVGIHSWDHPNLAHADQRTVLDQVSRSAALVERLTGQQVTLFRPPYGNLAPQMPPLGMSVVLWHLDPQDWRNWRPPNVGKTVDDALSLAEPSSILLLHDSHGPSVDAVAPIIDGLRAQGYTLVTVPELYGSNLRPDMVYGHI